MQDLKNKKNFCFLALFFILLNLNFLSAQTKEEKKDFQAIRDYYNTKNYDKVYKQAHDFIEKYPNGYYTPDAYFFLALMEKNYYSAVIIYKDLIEKFPQYSKIDETLYRLGKLYMLHDNLTESIKTFEKIINDYPKSDYFYGSHYYLGVNYLSKSDEENTFKYFDYIIQQNKKDRFYVLALIGKGNLYYDKKNYNKGIDFYKQALDVKLKNFYPMIYLGLGNSYMKLKDYENAYYYYKMILKDFPGSSEYELALDKLKYMNETKSILDKIDFEKIKMERPRAIVKGQLAKEFYTIQISSEKNKRFANDWRVKLKTQGFDSFFREYKSSTNVYYRTYVGKFTNQNDAEVEKKKIEMKYKIDCIITRIQEY